MNKCASFRQHLLPIKSSREGAALDSVNARDRLSFLSHCRWPALSLCWPQYGPSAHNMFVCHMHFNRAVLLFSLGHFMNETLSFYLPFLVVFLLLCCLVWFVNCIIFVCVSFEDLISPHLSRQTFLCVLFIFAPLLP